VTRRWGPRPAAGQTVTGSVIFGANIQISGVGGDVTVSLDRAPYRLVEAAGTPAPVSVAQAREQPSRLLLARHQVVPFTGREHTLDALAGWISGDEPVAIRLVHGAGGQGKTRLAAQVSVSCTAAGWTIWQAVHTPTPVAGSTPVSQAELPSAAVLVVVDYADRWPASTLLALLTQLRDLHTRAGTRIRVLMMARSHSYWWPALAERAEGDLSIETGDLALPPLALDSTDDRPTLFTAAADCFAEALNLERTGWPVPDLTGDGFAQILAVHMVALATVDATRHGHTPPVRADMVSAYLLRREQAYWQHLHTRTEAPIATPPEVMHRAVLTATLTGTQPRPAARQVLADTGFADSAAAADRIIDDHTNCYPPGDTRTVFEPLHPDRLGEDLIALSTPGHEHRGITNLERDWTPQAITDLLTNSTQPPVWATSAVTVLVETARRWPHIATSVLYPLIRLHPHLAIAAGGTALIRLTGIPDIDPTVLEPVEPLLPTGRHIDLDIAAAAISTVLTAHGLAHTSDPAEQARLHAIHAWRLANAGQREQALSPAEHAVTIHRRLAEANPDTHLSDLAGSLTNLGLILSGLGRRENAQVPTEEAVTMYRRLADADPDAYLSDLARSLTNLGLILSGLGRRENAQAPTEEAVTLQRRLVAANPDANLPDLAMSLNNLGSILSELGRREQALAPAEEAVTIRRRLAMANPDAYLPGLATSLTNLGAILSGLGRREQALAPAEEAVTICRQLAESNPDAYLPDLAASLTNFGAFLSGLGRREQALVPGEEAVIIYRQLAGANPDAYLPDLAGSLTNLGGSLSELGRWGEALPPTEEAIGIYRRLAEASPDSYLPDLAMSLNNLGNVVSGLGRREQALVSAEEAVTIRRGLADANPDAYLPDLAGSLTNFGNRLSRLGRREEALASTEEAVQIYRGLADASPDAHLPGLARALTNFGGRLSELGGRVQSLAPAEEAVAIFRRLALANPDAWLPALAMSLGGYAQVCLRVGMEFPAALAAVQESISLYQVLAERSPQAFEGFLILGYRVKADVLDGLGQCVRAADLRRQLDQATGENGW